MIFFAGSPSDSGRKGLGNRKMRNQPLKANPLVVAQQTTAGSVLMDVASSDCYELNHVGTQIWNRLMRGEEGSVIAQALSAEYGISIDQASADVEILMIDLTKHGLLIVADR